ncbi:hypothetical protein HLV37_02075 [Eggerthellaceae bacterium zg-1084]|uniref:Uncharacterized protein n=1 Tax=Berryella wangjianweii TaxID=2734634 RepID=A0A6M8J2G1_9ACTN|nr:hypothetical protein [Berryella wangjianweii]NPD30667.1 hypothetical protein [Berryella wangjianweii]QKF07311.1 hypothetical protein HLV38_03640 [Berryella wangjianweii]
MKRVSRATLALALALVMAFPPTALAQPEEHGDGPDTVSGAVVAEKEGDGRTQGLLSTPEGIQILEQIERQDENSYAAGTEETSLFAVETEKKAEAVTAAAWEDWDSLQPSKDYVAREVVIGFRFDVDEQTMRTVLLESGLTYRATIYWDEPGEGAAGKAVTATIDSADQSVF